MATIPFSLSATASVPCVFVNIYGYVFCADPLDVATSEAVIWVFAPKAILPDPASTFAFLPIAILFEASTAGVVPAVVLPSAIPTVAPSPMAIPDVLNALAPLPRAVALAFVDCAAAPMAVELAAVVLA